MRSSSVERLWKLIELNLIQLRLTAADSRRLAFVCFAFAGRARRWAAPKQLIICSSSGVERTCRQRTTLRSDQDGGCPEASTQFDTPRTDLSYPANSTLATRVSRRSFCSTLAQSLLSRWAADISEGTRTAGRLLVLESLSKSGAEICEHIHWSQARPIPSLWRFRFRRCLERRQGSCMLIANRRAPVKPARDFVTLSALARRWSGSNEL